MSGQEEKATPTVKRHTISIEIVEIDLDTEPVKCDESFGLWAEIGERAWFSRRLPGTPHGGLLH